MRVEISCMCVVVWRLEGEWRAMAVRINMATGELEDADGPVSLSGDRGGMRG